MTKPKITIIKNSIIILLCIAFMCCVGCWGHSVSATEASESTVTSIVTEIPNVETSVPQSTQETQEVTDTEIELPYDEPATDDLSEDSAGLLDKLDVNQSNATIDLVLLVTLLSLAPSILVMMTCFTRIIIAFSLLRNAMGVQQTPPNQVMIGLALFLTLFIMSPVISDINEVAYQPYKNGEMTTTEAAKTASVPLKQWMLKNTSNDTMDFFLELSGSDIVAEDDEEFVSKVSFLTVVPAFILSEIKIGFEIGFLLYIPFLIIDMVVSTVLMSMGMMMLPPAMISMPFKILLFILVDGWQMLAGALVNGFN